MYMNKLFSYPGGKWPIRHLIVSKFPKHQTYVDVFGGSAAILLTKEKSDGEVFNDKNKDIVNFFRVVKHRVSELAEESKHWIHSRLMWDELKKSEKPYDEILQAIRFWILLQDSFAARGMNYGTARESVRSVTHARKHLDQVSERLSDVHIENLDFSKVIKIYDSPTTFFYLDPPYPDTNGGDGNYDLLSEDEWRSMKKQLAGIQGKFLLSCNEHPFVMDLFKGFRIEKISVRVLLSRKKDVASRKEILISNYALPKTDKRIPVYTADKPAIKRIARKIVRKEMAR